jgi:hypothetical protein
MSFTGHLGEQVLGAILSVADAVVIPFPAPRSSSLLHEALAFSKPVLTAVGTSQLMRVSSPLIHECDFARPAQAAHVLAGALRPQMHGVRPSVRHSPQPARSAEQPARDIVLYNDWGIGDELLLTGVAREMKRALPGRRVWIRSRFGFTLPPFCESGSPPASAQSVEAIYQNPALYGPAHHAPFPGHLVQQMLDKVALDTGYGVVAADVRPEIVRRDPGQGRDPHAVVVHCRPNARLLSKDWGMPRWVALCELLHKRGIRLLQVGTGTEPLLPHAEDKRGLPPSEVPELIAAAGLVVCLDRKSTRLNSSHRLTSRMPSSA